MLQAHTPLAHAEPWLLEHSVLKRVANESGLTPAQVCIQWNLKHGVPVVPKCSSDHHASEILQAAAGGGGAPVLTAAQMKWLDALTPPGQSGRRKIKPPFMTGPGTKRHIYGWS